MNYKIKLMELDLDRRKVADDMEMTYQTLSSRLSGFTHWNGDEESRLRAIIARREEELNVNK